MNGSETSLSTNDFSRQQPLFVGHDEANNKVGYSYNNTLYDYKEVIRQNKKQIKEFNLKFKSLEAEVEPYKARIKHVERINFEGGKYTGQVLDNLPHGEGEWAEKDGVVFKGTWEFGLKEGLQVVKYGGRPVNEYNYKNGKLHGFQKSMLNDGTIVEYNYKDGKLNGEWRKTYASGKVETKTFMDGKELK